MSLRSGGNSSAWQFPATPIYPVAAQWTDSVENDPQVINGVTAIRVNSHGRLFVNIPSGTTTLTVWLANNLTGATFEVGVGVYVDGVYSTSWNPGAGSVSSLAPFSLTLDGAAHTVVIWSGYSQALTGTYVYALQGTGISIGTAPSAARRLTCYGDSITEGGASNPSAQLSWFALLRGIYPGAISQEAFGGRQLWDDCGSGSGQIGFANVTLLAQRLFALNAGASSREYWLAIGTNDIGAGHWDAATFGANYSALLDAIHATDPTGRIYAQTMLTDQGAWSTAITAAASGRSYCTAVDGTTLTNGGGFIGDGTHLTNAGSQAVALGTGAAAGVASIRGVLSV